MQNQEIVSQGFCMNPLLATQKATGTPCRTCRGCFQPPCPDSRTKKCRLQTFPCIPQQRYEQPKKKADNCASERCHALTSCFVINLNMQSSRVYAAQTLGLLLTCRATLFGNSLPVRSTAPSTPQPRLAPAPRTA